MWLLCIYDVVTRVMKIAVDVREIIFCEDYWSFVYVASLSLRLEITVVGRFPLLIEIYLFL